MASDTQAQLGLFVTRESTKRCCHCKSDLPKFLFGKDKRAPDGLARMCRPCRHIDWAKKHPSDPAPVVPDGMKRCGRCKTIRPKSDFTKGKNRKDGLYPTCKMCMSAKRAEDMQDPEKCAAKKSYDQKYREDNSETLIKNAKIWRSNNREHVNSQKRADRKAHPERHNGYSAKYRANNPEKRAESTASWERRNPEKVMITRAAWCRKNKSQLAAKSSARRAMKLQATPKWATEDSISAFYSEAKSITESSGVIHHVDHIVPLKSEFVCGLHCADNLQIIPGAENLSKNNRYWPDMWPLKKSRSQVRAEKRAAKAESELLKMAA